MPEEEESGFTVRDRRRVHVEDEAPAAAAAPTPVPAAPAFSAAERDAFDAAAEAEAFAAELEDEAGMMPGGVPSVFQVMAVFLNEMRTLALVRLGLVTPPDSNESLVDLLEAKVAIDTVTYLASQLEQVVAPEERLPLRAMVSDLQMAFMELTKNQGPQIQQ